MFDQSEVFVRNSMKKMEQQQQQHHHAHHQQLQQQQAQQQQQLNHNAFSPVANRSCEKAHRGNAMLTAEFLSDDDNSEHNIDNMAYNQEQQQHRSMNQLAQLNSDLTFQQMQGQLQEQEQVMERLERILHFVRSIYIVLCVTMCRSFYQFAMFGVWICSSSSLDVQDAQAQIQCIAIGKHRHTHT